MQPSDVVDFWVQAGPKAWFSKNDAFDAQIIERFSALHHSAARRELDGWADAAPGALALLLLLDQFPRNIFRGLASAFATDAKALGIAHKAIKTGHDSDYEPPLRRFFYLPMMHAEDLAEQDFCIERCRASGDDDGVKHGLIHRETIAKFGRFPYRNAVLGRANTQEEMDLLQGAPHGG